MTINIGKYRLEGGGMCPEQYDVFDGEKEVGYLRIRHGCFTADLVVDGQITREVYESEEPEGDGGFYDGEREKFLTAGVNAIDAALAKGSNDPN
jgi:hypothetical protein